MRSLVILIVAATSFCSPAWSQTPCYALGYYGGWYQPSLAKAEAALQYSKQKFSGVGDDEFSGNWAMGASFERRVSRHWNLRGEFFYWQKEAKQTVVTLEDSYNRNKSASGEGRATIRIAPILANFLYGSSEAKPVSLYGGMGAGFALTYLRIRAHVREVDSGQDGAVTTREVFYAQDANWGVLLQILAGVRSRLSAPVSLFAEARLLTGQFRVEERRYKVDEQVLLSGFNLVVGMRYLWGEMKR